MLAIDELEPGAGPTSGGDLVRLTGRGFAERIAVWFGDAPAEVVALLSSDGGSTAHVRTPPGETGAVDVRVDDLDDAGAPVERAVLPAGYRYERADLEDESDLTRLVRALLRVLKRDLLETTSLRVSVDYTPDGSPRPAPASLPALVLSGPRLARNRLYGTNEPRTQVVITSTGPELVAHRPPLTVDLVFTLRASSSRATELLNLEAAIGGLFARVKWLEMRRDAADPESETLRWELDLAGDFQTTLDGPDDLGESTVDVVVRGFDLEPGVVASRARSSEDEAVETTRQS